MDIPDGTIIPNGSELRAIEETYDLIDRMAPCGLAGCRQGHKRGFVVSFQQSPDSPLEFGIIGNRCGEREFKEHWRIAQGEHREAVARSQLISEWNRALQEAALVDEELRNLLPQLENLKKTRKALHRHAPGLMRRCAETARTLRAVLEEGGRRHQLAGRLFFSRDDTLSTAKSVRAQIHAAESAPLTAADDPRGILIRLNNFRQLLKKLKDVRTEAADGEAALTVENMGGVLRVLKDDSLRLMGDRLQVSEDGGQSWASIVPLSGSGAT